MVNNDRNSKSGGPVRRLETHMWCGCATEKREKQDCIGRLHDFAVGIADMYNTLVELISFWTEKQKGKSARECPRASTAADDWLACAGPPQTLA